MDYRDCRRGLRIDLRCRLDFSTPDLFQDCTGRHRSLGFGVLVYGMLAVSIFGRCEEFGLTFFSNSPVGYTLNLILDPPGLYWGPLFWETIRKTNIYIYIVCTGFPLDVIILKKVVTFLAAATKTGCVYMYRRIRPGAKVPRMAFYGSMLTCCAHRNYLAFYTAMLANLPCVRMIRICKISGQELPDVSTEGIHDIRDLKQKLLNLYGFPVFLQRLLHWGNRLSNSTMLESLQGGNSLDDSVQSDVPDAPIHLQLILLTASTAAELKETNVMFREACRCGKLETAQVLLTAGANKDWQDDHSSRTPLMEAACEGHTQIAELLLQAGADKDMQDFSGRTALMNAAFRGNTGVTQKLLGAGVEKDLQDGRGTTAPMRAALSGHLEMARLLLQAGVNKDLQNYDGTTALMMAAYNGHTEIVQLLLQAGAEKDLQDQSGWTALLDAACKGHTEIALMLLQAGANKDLQDQEGWTALELAARRR